MADTLSDNGGDDVAVTTLSLGQDASKEARIAQRKARIEIIRLQKQRQQTETEGTMIIFSRSRIARQKSIRELLFQNGANLSPRILQMTFGSCW